MQTKISVIIPIYNSAKYLEQCLSSIIRQTLNEIEIICINDGSTDNSLEILKEFSRNDSRIIVITQENAGAGAARNRGLSLAKGKYLSFLDADDFFEPTMLEDAYKACEERQLDFVVFRSDAYENEIQRFAPMDWTLRAELLPQKTIFDFHDIQQNLFRVFNGWAWDKLYRRDFVLNHHLYFQEQRTTNDLLFVFTALIHAERISTIDTVLAHQRRNISDSLSQSREKSWDCFYFALLALRESLIKLSLYEELEQDFINYALHFSLWNINTISKGESSKKLFSALKEEYWPELKLDLFPKEYFYYLGEYRQYQQIMGNDYEGFLKQKESVQSQKKCTQASKAYFVNLFRRAYVSIRKNGFIYTGKKLKQKIFHKK